MRKPVATFVTALLAAGGLAWGAGTPAAAGSSTHVRLMPLGASITEGYRSTTGNGYRGPLFSSLAAEGYTPDFVGNLRNGTMTDPDHEGHSGWRIDQIAGITDATLARWKPNVVTLQIGTNDLAQSYQVATVSNRLDALIDKILADDPGVTVLVSPLLPSTDPTIQANRAEYDRQVPLIVQAKRNAGKHVGFVDTSAVKVSDLADDRHPGDAGYQKVADAFNAALLTADSAGWIKPPVPNGGPVRSGVGGGGKCLDVNGGSSANGAAVQIWSCNAGAAQWWTLRADGTLRALGKCLDATGAGTANGTKAEIWDCNGGGNQQWQPYNGGYRNPVSGRCLDNPGFSTTDGTQLDLWTCDGGINQHWTTLPAVP